MLLNYVDNCVLSVVDLCGIVCWKDWKGWGSVSRMANPACHTGCWPNALHNFVKTVLMLGGKFCNIEWNAELSL